MYWSVAFIRQIRAMHPAVARVDIESTSNYPLDATTPRQQIVASLVVHKQSA